VRFGPEIPYHLGSCLRAKGGVAVYIHHLADRRDRVWVGDSGASRPCRQAGERIAEHQARTYGVLLSAYGLMQFLFAPILGNLSDRFGRRPVILFSLLFTGVDYVSQATAPAIGWLFVGESSRHHRRQLHRRHRIYCRRHASEKRAQNFGMMGAAFGFGSSSVPHRRTSRPIWFAHPILGSRRRLDSEPALRLLCAARIA